LQEKFDAASQSFIGNNHLHTHTHTKPHTLSHTQTHKIQLVLNINSKRILLCGSQGSGVAESLDKAKGKVKDNGKSINI
jgi:hypothetical protein